MKKGFISSMVLAIIFFGSNILSGNGSRELSIKVANLSEDVALLSKEVRQLRLEIEELGRENGFLKGKLEDVCLENARLKAQVSKESVQIGQLSSSFDNYQKNIGSLVSEQMEAFSKETQKAMDLLASNIVKRSEPKKEFRFTDDYPKEGLAYTVKSGDTLSGIALKHHSSTKDIQNANKIGDPKDLRAGQEIFIPQKTSKE